MPTLDLTNRKPLEELRKLPKPTNKALAELFSGVDKVIVKDSLVYEGKAMSDKIVLTISKNTITLCFKVLQNDPTAAPTIFGYPQGDPFSDGALFPFYIP